MAESIHRFIRMSGTPYERGVQYGKAASDMIARVVDEYKLLFDKESHMQWDAAVRLAARYEDAVRAYRPDLIDEMQGIAEGSGQTFATILTLNCRSEIMFAQPADECSAIGVPPEASGDGKTYIGQNWDWWSVGVGTTVILEIDQPPYAKAMVVTEAGLVGGKGMNVHGIGQTMNALSVYKGQIGVPLQVILRHSLSQATVPKAIDAIAKAKRAGSACVGLADKDGIVISVEYAPNNMDILLCGGKPLCHTNHWLSPIMTAWKECSRYSFTSTYTRLDRVRRLSAQQAGHLTDKELFKIFTDHAGCPDSVCRHSDMTIPVYHRHMSVWSMVIDTVDQTLWLTEGNPCCTQARPYRFTQGN